MKCIINCRSNDTEWVDQFFPEYSVYMLKIANKPLLEYYLDFCKIHNIEEVRIVMDEPDTAIENFFKDGSRWGESISYSISKPGDSIDKVIHKNKSFIGDSDLIVIDGPIFIWYNKNEPDSALLTDTQHISAINVSNGNLLFIKSAHLQKDEKITAIETNTNNLSVTSLNSIQEYFEHNQKVLTTHRNDFYMPGYNNDEGIYIGQNVEIPRNVTITKPVIIGDNVRLKSLTSIGPNTILGDNIVIDSSTMIHDSIICDGTYIGRDLELSQKIVNKDKLIEPHSAEVVNVHDRLIISEIDTHLLYRMIYRTFHYISAIIISIVSVFPFLLFCLFFTLTGNISFEWQDFFITHKCKTSKLLTLRIRKKGWMYMLFQRLSLDKFPLLIQVIAGKIYTAGNTLLEDNENNGQIIRQMNKYQPAVFSYTESVAKSKIEIFEFEINELYYSNNMSMTSDLTLIFFSLLNRLLYGKIEFNPSKEK